jgi:1-acyl-sn-glycerol-3-phosphate acyltransferase
MNDLKEPPIGILLTMPRAFFEDRGWDEKQFAQYFERLMRHEDSIWNFRKKTLPTHDVIFCYLVFGGKVQFKLNIVGYDRNVAKTFYDGPDARPRNFEASNWIILTGPAIKPPHEIPMKGFQGFHYVTKELF